MKEPHLSELDDRTRWTLECWRAEAEPTALFDAALDRLAANPPTVETRRLAPSLAAAALAGLTLLWVPSAFAALAQTARQPLAAMAAIDPELRAAWRPLVLVHVCFLVAGYAVWLAAWGLAQADLFLRLLNVRRLSRPAARWGPVGSAVATGLWGVGVILGGVWASAVLGRFWGWDPKENGGLFTVAVGVAWWLVGRRLRDRDSVLPALVAAAGLWLMVYSYWWSTWYTDRVPGFERVRFAIHTGALLNALLLATVWLIDRRQSRVSTSPSDRSGSAVT
jgi:hypothetical protein